MLYPVILAGGVGKRLWPMSSQNNPKQFQAFLGDQTLLQSTYQRLEKYFGKKNIFVITTTNIVPIVKKQINLADKNIFVEPNGKGTAMAIGLAALKLKKIDSQATMVTINSDHYIKDQKKYLRMIQQAEKLVAKYPKQMILMGIKPDYPETGYGYIELGDKISPSVYKVKSFKEKPNLKTAQQYLEAGNFLWNPAIFVFKVEQLLKWYQKYLPELYQILINIEQIESTSQMAKEYSKIKKVSIDVGLLEKMSDMLIIPADFSWVDVGHWRSLRDVLLNDRKDKNVTNTHSVSLDSKNNLLYSSSGKLIAVLGVKDMALVETDQAILLCPIDRSQDIKQLLDKIKKQGLDKYL